MTAARPTDPVPAGWRGISTEGEVEQETMTNPNATWFWRTVQWLEESSPTIGANLKKIFIQYGVPFNRAIGVRVVAVTADGQGFKLRLPYRRRNTNVEGTVHGAVITAFAETVLGVAVYWQFPPSSISMVTREIVVTFLAPAEGDLFIEYRLEARDRDRILADLGAVGRCDIWFTCQVVDQGNRAIAQLRASFAIRTRRATQASGGAGAPPAGT